MNANAAPVIVAAINRARRQISGHFMHHRAIAPGDAVDFVPDRPIVKRQFEKMLARGVVKQAGAGRYWLDIDAYNADIARRRGRLVPVVIALAILAAVLLTFLYQG